MTENPYLERVQKFGNGATCDSPGLVRRCSEANAQAKLPPPPKPLCSRTWYFLTERKVYRSHSGQIRGLSPTGHGAGQS